MQQQESNTPSNTSKQTTTVRKRTAKKGYSYESMIEAKRENPWKPATAIIKELGIDISPSMAQRVLRNAKRDGLL